MKPIDPSNAVISQADVMTQAVQAAQDQAAIVNAAKRQAERQAKFDAWIDPEAMIHRKALNDLRAIESLWSLRASGNAVTQTPIPPDSELPKELRGQSPSTIRAMLRGNPEWEKKVKAHQEVEAQRGGFRERYPELYGLDDQAARRKWNKDESKVDNMVGKATFSVSAAAEGPTVAPEVEKKTTWFEGVKSWFK